MPYTFFFTVRVTSYSSRINQESTILYQNTTKCVACCVTQSSVSRESHIACLYWTIKSRHFCPPRFQRRKTRKKVLYFDEPHVIASHYIFYFFFYQQPPRQRRNETSQKQEFDDDDEDEEEDEVIMFIDINQLINISCLKNNKEAWCIINHWNNYEKFISGVHGIFGIDHWSSTTRHSDSPGYQWCKSSVIFVIKIFCLQIYNLLIFFSQTPRLISVRFCKLQYRWFKDSRM